MQSIKDALDKLGNYPGETMEKIPVVHLFQEKRRQAKQEIYKNAITDIILANCFCMWNFLLFSFLHFP